MDTFNWITAIAVGAQALFALILVCVTYTYAKDTRRMTNIAQRQITQTITTHDLEVTPNVLLFWPSKHQAMRREKATAGLIDARHLKNYHLLNLSSGPIWIQAWELTASVDGEKLLLDRSGTPAPLLQPGDHLAMMSLTPEIATDEWEEDANGNPVPKTRRAAAVHAKIEFYYSKSGDRVHIYEFDVIQPEDPKRPPEITRTILS